MPTILMVVDDEPDVQLLMKQKFRKQLRNKEYEFIFAANGTEALEKLKDNPDIDVILCDVNMPEMDGITLLSKTKAVSPTAQTVIVSAYGDMRNIRRAMNNGAFDFVTKPINFNDLGATISKTIKHVSKLKDTISEKEQLHQKLERYSRNLEKTIEERTNEITRQKEIIEAKNQSITESINYAKRIQEAALPRIAEVKDTLPNIFIFFKPRDIVSGDFYWYSSIDDGKVVITAADCTGHGVPGAFMSLIGNDLLNEIVKAREVTAANSILNELHESVRKALRQEENRSRDGMDVALCVIDEKNQKLDFAGAKNPLVYFQKGKMNVIKGDKYPIGGVQYQLDRDYQIHQIDISEPTMAYIFSDGYQDQFGGEKGEKFMSKNFKALLEEIHQKPIDQQEQILRERLQAWMGDRPQIDDILVIGMKF